MPWGMLCIRRFQIAGLRRVNVAMYEFLLMLSVFLALASLYSPVEWLLVQMACAGTNAVVAHFARSAPEEADDLVLPFELVIQQALAKRRAQRS